MTNVHLNPTHTRTLSLCSGSLHAFMRGGSSLQFSALETKIERLHVLLSRTLINDMLSRCDKMLPSTSLSFTAVFAQSAVRKGARFYEEQSTGWTWCPCVFFTDSHASRNHILTSSCQLLTHPAATECVSEPAEFYVAFNETHKKKKRL